MQIIYATITIFGLATIIGIYLLSLLLQGKKIPEKVATVHGVFAIIGLLLLIMFSLKNNETPAVSIIVLILAAMGGLMLAYRGVANKKIPKWLGVTHGMLALVGFAFLILFAFTNHPGNHQL
jgi:peptidoglycan/LPS O-acetylase OafA/YrhL